MAVPVRYSDSAKYIEFSLDADEVPANDTDVCACFKLPAEAIAACYRNDGLDCVVTLADGTLVARELRNFSKANSTGILWFKIPAVSTVTGGTTMYVQLGGASVNVANSTQPWANCYGGSNTWSLVCHADDNVDDSGTTGNHGTFNGSPQYGTTSQFGYEAIQVAGDSDYTSFPHNANLSGGNGTTDNPYTILFWCKPTSYETIGYIIKGLTSATLDYAFYIHSNKSLYTGVYDGASTNTRRRYYPGIDDTGQWRHYAGTYGGSNPVSTLRVYRQGTRVDTTSSTGGTYVAMEGDSDVLSVGYYQTGGIYGNFAWCVFRVGQFQLSANQILQSYNIESQAATNGAYTVGALTDFSTSAVPVPVLAARMMMHGR